MGTVMYMKKGEVHTAPYIPTIPLSELMEGTIVMIEENGVKVPFYVAQQEFTDGGSTNVNRVLMVRKECYDTRAWHDSNVNSYDDSTINSWLTKTYLRMFSESVQDAIATTKIVVTVGNGNGNTYWPAKSVFLLSMTELGFTLTVDSGNVLAEGVKLPTATLLKTATLNGEAVAQWTRTPDTNDTTNAYSVSASGGKSSKACTTVLGCRPCFTLPSSALVSEIPNADGSVDLRI